VEYKALEVHPACRIIATLFLSRHQGNISPVSSLSPMPQLSSEKHDKITHAHVHITRRINESERQVIPTTIEGTAECLQRAGTEVI
jgi:phenylalanyl-tRNA synthetase beta subunit